MLNVAPVKSVKYYPGGEKCEILSPVDHLHAVKGHLHVDQDREVLGDARGTVLRNEISFSGRQALTTHFKMASDLWRLFHQLEYYLHRSLPNLTPTAKVTCMRMRRISIAIMGLFSTRSGNLAGVRPRPRDQGSMDRDQGSMNRDQGARTNGPGILR